jgi:autoinducer 2 (AI-2) kinase
MSDELLLAIDAGTGSCRAVLFDLEGRQLGLGQREYRHQEISGIPGSQAFETRENWLLICECVRETLSAVEDASERIAAVSATSMREGMVLYDARGREIWACPNVDSRAGEEAGELVEAGAAERIYDLAGDWVSITAPARFVWIARHEPELFASIAHIGMLGDWILTRLSGEFATDPSLGSSSGMFDLAQRKWSPEVLDLIGVPAEVCPRVVEPGSVIGVVTPAAAGETGLRPGTPVIVGGADTQLGLLGIGVTTGQFTIVGGSFWQHTLLLDEPLIDPKRRLRTLCHTIPDQWMVEGIGFYCGMVMRWFRDSFGGNARAQAGQEGIDAYTILEREASEIPVGSNGIFALFSNVMQASRWVHGPAGFLGFDVSRPERSGHAVCFRAIEESAAYVSVGHLQIVEELSGRSISEAVMTGGAAKATLWPQIIADAIGVPVRIPAVKESTALGAAIYAGVGAGLYNDPSETARDLVRFERTAEPNAAAHETYSGLYDRWIELYQRALPLSESGLVRPLWRAAGT